MTRDLALITAAVLCFGFGATAQSADAAQDRTAAPRPRAQLIARTWLQHQLPADVTLVTEHNGAIHPRSLDFHTETPWAPRLQRLRAQEQLDAALGDDADEWTRMQRLSAWAYDQWSPSTPRPIPAWDALEVLASARAGAGGFCAQYAIVQVQAALSLGWQARYLSLETAAGEGHVGVEMWSDAFGKWAVLDPHFGAWVVHERELETPLSALEIHAALEAGEREQLQVRSVGGDEQLHPRPDADFIAYFHHLAADQRNDHLSGPPQGWSRRESYLSWRDGHTDGRPEIFDQLSEEAAAFDAPHHQLELTLLSPPAKHAQPGRVLVALRTNMTALHGFELQLDDEAPRSLPLHPSDRELGAELAQRHDLASGTAPARALDLHLGQLMIWSWQLTPGRHRLSLRGVNDSGVRGPAATLELEFSP